MLTRLSKHPFPVDAHFDFSLVLTYAYERDVLAAKIPPGLELDVFGGRWGFVAVAMVKTRALRPKGFPAWAGNDFFLTGYRIFVRYRSQRGQKLRGLYILRSETDKRRMRWLGNLFTSYRYQTADFEAMASPDGQISVRSRATGLVVEADTGGGGDVPLPPASPFADWRQARRFAGPMPFTFSATPREMVIVVGIRQNWKPQAANVRRHEVPFLTTFSSAEPRLANAFVVRDVPYSWKRGRTEPLP